MINAVCFISFLLIALFSGAQHTAIKLGAWLVPSADLWGTATVGAEFFQKKNNNRSWQVLFSVSGGSFGTDAGIIKRQYLTLDRIFLRRPMMKHDNLFLSFFTEAGNRKNEASQFKREGYRLIDAKQFEVNPGIAVGANFIIKKRWSFDMIGGPKLIIASGKKRYFNPAVSDYESYNFNSVEAGYRFMINLSYSLKRNE